MKAFFLFLFFVPFVFGAYAGQTEVVYSIPTCFEHILINVSGSQIIDSGEYSLVGCENLSNNFWSCNCDNPTDILLNTSLTTVNEYTFKIQWFTETGPQIVYVPTGGGSSSGGGGGYVLTPEQAARWKGEEIKENEPEIIYRDREILAECEPEEPDFCPPINNTVEIVEVPVEKKNPWFKWVFAGLGLIILVLVWHLLDRE